MDKESVNTNAMIVHFVLKPNGNFPNNQLPVLIYKHALNLPEQKNKAAKMAQQIFSENDWGNTWRDGIYDFHHYHSNTHECLAVVTGDVRLMLGGPDNKTIKAEAGDVIILPAGTGHQCISASQNFLCVGGYPQGKNYDMKHGKASELEEAVKRIAEVPLPVTDPVFGKGGFIRDLWG